MKRRQARKIRRRLDEGFEYRATTLARVDRTLAREDRLLAELERHLPRIVEAFRRCRDALVEWARSFVEACRRFTGAVGEWARSPEGQATLAALYGYAPTPDPEIVH